MQTILQIAARQVSVVVEVITIADQDVTTKTATRNKPVAVVAAGTLLVELPDHILKLAAAAAVRM